VTTIRDLPDIVLGPLRDRPDTAWSTAPAGKWTPGEIVAHLAQVLDRSATGFEARAEHAPMTRRGGGPKQFVARNLVLGTGWFPRGRKAPEGSAPPASPNRATTEADFRRGVERFMALEQKLLPRRAKDLFLKHPVLGDLTLGEFMRFHVVHSLHHAKQIRGRLGE
jgi:hypothetical protein